MFLSLLLDIAPQPECWHHRPGALRAFAYELFRLSDPALADRLHEMASEKPFTIALLANEAGPRLRLTTVTEEAGGALLRSIRKLSPEPRFTFARTRVRVRGCELAAPPLAEQSSCLALGLAPFVTHVGLRFVSPTAFKQNGLHVPLPLPNLLLRGWARRWNLITPPDAHFSEELLTALTDKVALAQARIATRMADLDVSQMVGFTGDIVLEAIAPHTWTPDEKVAFTVLTRFSRFCGTGVWTTQGLGLTLPTS